MGSGSKLVLPVLIGVVLALGACAALQSGPGGAASDDTIGGLVTLGGLFIPPPFNMLVPAIGAIVSTLLGTPASTSSTPPTPPGAPV